MTKLNDHLLIECDKIPEGTRGIRDNYGVKTTMSKNNNY